MPWIRLRFAFTDDGRPAGGQSQMSVTYVGGHFSRRKAEADARRRFEEWRQLSNPVTRRFAADQVVVG